MPNGPSASIVQRIDGPSARRNVLSAASSPAVTAGFELGLMTRMSARAMSCPFDNLAVTIVAGSKLVGPGRLDRVGEIRVGRPQMSMPPPGYGLKVAKIERRKR